MFLQVVGVGDMEAVVEAGKTTMVEWRTHTNGLTAMIFQVHKIVSLKIMDAWIHRFLNMNFGEKSEDWKKIKTLLHLTVYMFYVNSWRPHSLSNIRSFNYGTCKNIRSLKTAGGHNWDYLWLLWQHSRIAAQGCSESLVKSNRIFIFVCCQRNV